MTSRSAVALCAWISACSVCSAAPTPAADCDAEGWRATIRLGAAEPEAQGTVLSIELHNISSQTRVLCVPPLVTYEYDRDGELVGGTLESASLSPHYCRDRSSVRVLQPKASQISRIPAFDGWPDDGEVRITASWTLVDPAEWTKELGEVECSGSIDLSADPSLARRKE